MVKVCPSCRKEYTRLGQHLALSSCDYPEISDHHMDIVVGALMGDGTITQGPHKNAQVNIGSTTVKYLEYLKKVLPSWLVNSIYLDTKADSRPNPEKTKDYYGLSLMRHPKFTEMRKEWYPSSGKKKFPLDLSLNDTRLKHWFVTDGSIIHRPGNARPRINIACVNESQNPEFIVDLIGSVGIQAHYDQHGGYRINVDDTEELFDFIGEPVPGFEYKWP